MTHYNHHYLVNYNSQNWEDRTTIISRVEPYQDVEHFVQETQQEENDSSIQVEEFKEISGVAAFVLNLFDGIDW
jgi:hypothetical protein